MDTTLDALTQKLTTGIYLATAGRGEGACVLTQTWVTQVTTDPPRVMIAIRPYRKQHALLRAGEPFCIHLLGRDQFDVALRYTDKEQPAGPEFKQRDAAAPLWRGAAAWLDCEVENYTPLGDHDIFVGKVVGGEVLRHVETLTTAHFGDPYRTDGAQRDAEAG